MEDRLLLARSDMFAAFDDDELRRVLADARSLRCQRNQALFNEGDEADEMFVVRRGRIAIGRHSPDGRESLVALMEAGDLFGEMPLFDNQPRSASARALEASELLAIPYTLVKQCLDGRPRAALGRRRDARAAPTLDRLGARRCGLPRCDGPDGQAAAGAGRRGGRVRPARSPRRSWPGLVGASRERVNKAIAAFLRLGWIEQSDRRYRITERERLTQRAR